MARKVNKAKSALVKALRGASPEEVVEGGQLLEVLENANHPNQVREIYLYKGYVWVVVVGIFPPRFITAYKSSKLNRRYKL